ncbi:MAG: CDGSH iron-sulfur domain-containing protein [Planctomycetota bacterium]
MSDSTNGPVAIEVKSGDTKAFCTCSNSKNGVFCDGAHAGTDKTPCVTNFTEDKTIHACGCGKSSNFPYCDGSHAK